MTRDDAEFIAQCFMDEMNEKMWDGKDDKPSYFDERIYEFPITSDLRLDLSFCYDTIDEKWEHLCEIIKEDMECVVYCQYGCGINSVQNIADTICFVWEGYCELYTNH